MKNVLLLVHEDEGQEARFQAAVDATRALEGHLTCLDVVEFAPVPGDGYGLADGGLMLMEAERQIERENRIRLEQRLKIEGLSWEWIDVIGGYESALERWASLADLVVVNREVPDLKQAKVRKLVEPLVVRSGKPILAAVDDDGFNAAGHALVAWDGSSAASAALHSAVPLLAFAESVTILQIEDGSIDAPAVEAAEYLSRHRIEVEILFQKVPGPEFVEPVLLSKVQSGQFDWLVMGAFSKSRFREAFFGGVTRRMLEESPIPLLVAH